ncbi:hypothetical protein KDW99_13455 [Marinomonas rhizomae]|uniref:hypothetical protein n=1 Tax=Marinomonas rhizomae TaxID=491948 RepID=UPI002101DD8C|nr:hypothetical protein [Marinomonas rhizomae]UTV98270.1 hypothetical protein KDW99_13455 [Marinomonas rhizomae]
MRSIEAIIKDIDEYVPVNGQRSTVNGEWESLDELIDEACTLNDRRVVKPLLGVLERNQDHDGYGAFWSIVHGLESLEGYESDLAASVLSRPHEMGVLMLNRMLNGGIQKIDGRLVLEILEEIGATPAFPISIREEANHFLAYQRDSM